MKDQDALMLYARTQNAEAFRHLVLTHQALVYSVCARVLNNQAEAEDAAQETFIRLAENAHKIRSNISSWLHSCARRCAIDRLRSEISRKNREYSWVTEHQEPLSMEEFSKLLVLLDECLEEVESPDRELIVQHYYLGRTQKEIAAEVGLTRMAISKRLDKAVEQLRSKMAKKGVMLGAAALAGYLTQTSVQAVTVPATLTTSLTKIGLSGIGKTSTITIGGIIMTTTIKTTITAVVIGIVGVSAVLFTKQISNRPVVPKSWVMRSGAYENPSEKNWWKMTKGDVGGYYTTGIDEGGASIFIRSLGKAVTGQTAGALLCPVKATNYRGKLMRLTAEVKGAPGTRAGIVYKLPCNNGGSMSSNIPQQSLNEIWQVQETTFFVFENLEGFYVGMVQDGPGQSWARNFKLEVLGETPPEGWGSFIDQWQKIPTNETAKEFDHASSVFTGKFL